MYARIVRKIPSLKSTGTSTHIQLIRQRVCLGPVCPPIYHLGLIADNGSEWYIFEHGPVQYDRLRTLESTTQIPLPTVWNSIDDIRAFETTLPRQYLVGIRDCRHHVLDLLDYLYDDH